jgi:predicted ABC-type ATPase
VADAATKSCITVLAGTDGAGKSSLAGAMLRHAGGDYFNPDEVAHRIRQMAPELTVQQANSRAWTVGKRLFERAIAERRSFAFETTLGGRTITSLLGQALASGLQVKIWYAGLVTPDLHIARVRSRVARGGHDIPEPAIRRRYKSSLQNLVRLLPKLSELRVFDNSHDGDPHAGRAPRPALVLHMKQGRIVAPSLAALAKTPKWARPIVAAAMKRHRGRRRSRSS